MDKTFASEFYLDCEPSQASLGSEVRKIGWLKLTPAPTMRKPTHADHNSWSQIERLHGENRIAILTLSEVPIQPAKGPK